MKSWAILAFLAVASSAAVAGPKYQLDRTNSRVVALSGLSSGGLCQSFEMTGTIAGRKFNGARVVGITVKDKAGIRSYVNIEPVTLDNADMVTIGWANQGLQQLTRKGSRVRLRIDACGAAGRVMMLDAISAIYGRT